MRFKLHKLLSLSFLALLLLLFIALSSYQVFRDISDFHHTAQKMRGNFISQQKSMIKREVERAVHDIRYGLKSIDVKVLTKLRSTVSKAHQKFTSIYKKYEGKKTKAEILRLAQDVLAPVAVLKSKQFYLIFNGNGRILLNTINQSSSRQKDIQILKDKLKYIIQNLRSGQNEIFLPVKELSTNGLQVIKGYIYAQPIRLLNLYIASYGSSKEIEEATKEELLGKIAHIRFGREGYIFINRYDGTALLSNGQRNQSDLKLWEAFGEKVRPVFQMEVQAAQKSNGDFIYYRWQKLSSDSLSPKASFIMGVPEWQWIVGAGVYLDDIEKSIHTLQKQLSADVKKSIIVNIGILLFILIIFLILRYFLSDLLDKEFSLFLSFFRSAAHNNEKINLNKIRSQEFYELARHANKMLEDKQSIEKKLSDEKENLSVTLRSIADSVITTDINGNITSINPVAEKLTGFSHIQAVGKPLWEVFKIYDSETGHSLKNPVQQLMEKKDVVLLSSTTLLKSEDGSEYHIEDSAAPIRDAQGNIIGAVIVFRDVTEKLKNEQEIQKVKKLESIGILAGGIAHDFNNLLTGISGNLSLMEIKLAPNDKLQKYIQSAKKAVERATNLTGQLLTFSKGGEPIRENIKIDTLVEEVAKFNLRGSNVKLHLKTSRSLWAARVDKSQLSQVIANLVINGKQAMPQGGNLHITLNNVDNKSGKIQIESDHCIRIRIKDEGSGIPAKIIDKIFDPYFTTKQSGSGLGLSTVFSIIKRHGGYIDVKSHSGKGSTFTIYLPAVVLTEEKVSPKRIQSNGTKKANVHSLHVLVMDDEEIIRSVSADMLASLGCTVEFAGEGQQALDLYRRSLDNGHPFDLVIMDLTIPGGMGGKEAIVHLLNLDPQARVLVASGYSKDPILSNYREYGFAGRIVKPFRIEEVQRTIESLFS